MASKSTSQVGVEDRISQLPENVLVHILSFLPTVYSVGTMVLSKRWNNLWTSVPNLDFDQQDIGQGDFDSFATFVERALSLHKSSSTIRKFRLHFLRRNIYLNDMRIARIRNWICTAMSSHEVGEVDILLVPYNGKNVELKLPRRLFLCKTLEVLKVESNCITYPSTKPGYFPSLKFANVTAKYTVLSSMRQLFCYCPVLEELFIEADIDIDEEDFEVSISAPELKTLRTRFWGRAGKSSICINASKLENLVVTDKTYGLTKYYLKNAKSMVEAKIDLYYLCYQTYSPSYFHRATALLAGVSGVQYLSMSGPNLLECSLPTFNNLMQLKLRVFRCSYWGYVMELLKRSPKLEDLVLDINVHSWYDEKYGYDPFTPPEIVPVCVVSHLKTISITNFMGHDDERDVVKYLFKYGEVLKKITVSTSGPLLFKTCRLTEQKLQSKLLKYQKSSKSCEVEVKFQTKGLHSWTCSDCGSRKIDVDI